ncbi:MAG TPA: hypothetical protein VLG44_08270 [Chlamydiales bacterium]|nr:hypothetical protein [Chlamydiales bacterium]
MNKSKTTSPVLLKRIDELLISAHSYLEKNDEVYYLGEYTNRQPASHSDFNQLILNYKKDPSRKGKPEWEYKEVSIKKAADMLRLSLLQTNGFPSRIKHALLVPIPPHASKSDLEHDDRNLRMLLNFMPRGNVHELIEQKETRAPLHESNKRDPKTLEENYRINPPNQGLEFKEIWLFDDVLRKGTHFRAISNLLCKRFPNIPIVGFFIARSIN